MAESCATPTAAQAATCILEVPTLAINTMTLRRSWNAATLLQLGLWSDSSTETLRNS